MEGGYSLSVRTVGRNLVSHTIEHTTGKLRERISYFLDFIVKENTC